MLIKKKPRRRIWFEDLQTVLTSKTVGNAKCFDKIQKAPTPLAGKYNMPVHVQGN
jgi:hypothetical protein